VDASAAIARLELGCAEQNVKARDLQAAVQVVLMFFF
jgi:hypothetical protein